MAGRRLAISLGLSALSAVGLHRLAPSALRGRGVILTLHRVRPFAPALPGFAPNALLEITPEFLDAALKRLRDDSASKSSIWPRRRAGCRRRGRRFAALTFDDGYRDFTEHALPVLERHAAPATLFLVQASSRAGRGCGGSNSRRRSAGSTGSRTCRRATRARRPPLTSAIYWRLRARPEAELLAACQRLSETAGVREERIARGPVSRLARDRGADGPSAAGVRRA